MIRIGAGLIGIDPAGLAVLRGALTLTAPVIAVRSVEPGTSTGYGRSWVASHRTTLATVAVGYADGIPRVASNRAEVAVAGRRCPIVGRVSMDQLVVDVGDLPVGAGDVAVIFGPGDSGEPTCAEWARWCGTIPHEIVTGIGPRVRRRVMAVAR